MIPALESTIESLRQQIARLERDQGWNLSQNLYDRGWKKDLAARRRELAILVRMVKQSEREAK